MDMSLVNPAKVDRREFLTNLGGSAALAAATAPAFAAGKRISAPAPKKLVIIMTDQQHFDTIAAAGCPHVVTPAMDRLMADGISFGISSLPQPGVQPGTSIDPYGPNVHRNRRIH
jgi:hypothetical protein